MDYSYTSPPLSPQIGMLSYGQVFDSTSESPSPQSPYPMHRISFSGTMPYDVFHHGHAPTHVSAAARQAKIPGEYHRDPMDAKDHRKRHSMGNAKPGEKETVSNMHMRRRAQNRASQRAFRERKEKHVKGLEHQLEDLHEKHQDLLQSYTKQADEVSRLNAKISDLNGQLNAIRSSRDSSYSELLIPEKFDKFDAFGSANMLYSGPDCYFDKHAVDLHSEFALHSFEESL